MPGKWVNSVHLRRQSRAAESVCWSCKSRLRQLNNRKNLSPQLLDNLTSESRELTSSVLFSRLEQDDSTLKTKSCSQNTPSRTSNTKPSYNPEVKQKRSGNFRKTPPTHDGPGKDQAVARRIPFPFSSPTWAPWARSKLEPDSYFIKYESGNFRKTTSAQDGPGEERVAVRHIPFPFSSPTWAAWARSKLESDSSSGSEVTFVRQSSKHDVVYYKRSSMVKSGAKEDAQSPPTGSMIKLDHERKSKGVLEQALVGTKNLTQPTHALSLAATAPGSSGLYYSKGFSHSNAIVSRPRLYSTSATSRPSSTHETPPLAGSLSFPDSPLHGRPVNIRESLRIWQMRRDAEKEVNTSSTVKVSQGAQELQHFLTQGYTNPKAGKPAHIDDEDDNLVAQYSDEDHIVELNEPQPMVRPGDMVELNMHGEHIMAIYVRSFLRQAQFYTIYGKWVHQYVRNLYFIVPGFVECSEVAGLLSFLPKEAIPTSQLDQSFPMGSGVPRSVGAGLVEKMNEFVRSSDEVYRAHADRIDRAYLLTSDEVNLRYLTLTDIAATVLQLPDKSQMTYPSLFAVNRAIKQVEIGFRVDFRDHWRTQMFEILPQRDVRLVFKVREWLREYQEHQIGQAKPHYIEGRHKSDKTSSQSKETQEVGFITNFIIKAREIISESRKFRPLIITDSKHGIISTSSIQVEAKPRIPGKSKTCTSSVILGHYTDVEFSIIKFIELWAATKYLSPGSALCAMGSMFLRATGLYEQCELTERTGYIFLKELGVLAPWENRAAFTTRLALPGYYFDPVTEELQSKAESSVKDAMWSDTMAHLRKDWGNLEVFCVDGAGALEIDDGFSLEPVDGDESQFWIHVHIANPTAFIGPEDPLSKYAARLVESVYFPEKAYQMLNPQLTQRHCSLQKDRPALTFSAKVDIIGNILDINIVPSIVRNVVFLTPGRLLTELAPDALSFRPISSLTVGFNPPPPLVDPPLIASQIIPGRSKYLNSSQKEILSKLLELALARQRQREAKGAIASYFNRMEVSVHYLTTTQPYRRTIRRVDGDPTVSFEVPDFNPMPDDRLREASIVDSLVPNIMILAGEVAATWTSKRGIPVPYRGTQANPEFGSALEYKKTVLDPLVEKKGLVPLARVGDYLCLAGRGYTSIDSVEHRILGTNAYTKVTSPLRRYGDMLTHWQIEAAIRHEAETGQSLIGSTDRSFLPFSRSVLQRQIDHISIREVTISNNKRTSEQHWVLQALFRAFYLKEAVLPETFETFILAQDMYRLDECSGMTKQLALKAYMKQPKESMGLGTMEVGDWWECKIADIDLYRLKIYMKPVRLITKAADGPQMARGDVWIRPP